MTNKGAIQEAICLSGHIFDFNTHTSTICIRYQVLLAAYYKAGKANTHLFIHSFFLFLLLDTYSYSLLCYFSFSFIHSVLPPPKFCHPRRPPICLVVKVAVCAQYYFMFSKSWIFLSIAFSHIVFHLCLTLDK
jgi:hypothetical protein